jgi:hypothetical protein
MSERMSHPHTYHSVGMRAYHHGNACSIIPACPLLDYNAGVAKCKAYKKTLKRGGYYDKSLGFFGHFRCQPCLDAEREQKGK